MFFNLKVDGSGLATPLGNPKPAAFEVCIWDPYGALSSPIKLETPGLEVVLSANVLAVGAVLGLCLDLCF